MAIPILFVHIKLQDLKISTDYLTNMNNRNQLIRYLTAKIRTESENLYLFMMDVDKFKSINDNYGHTEGDNALISVADKLKEVAREFGGIIARYGGDEFAMALVGDVNIADDYEAIRERIHQHSMKDPFVQELDYNINASMGIAECVITDDVDLDSLIKLADMRMYEDKEARKGSNEIR